nr:hypothetical protein [Candidatus Baldrarchaeota archaeon]
MMEKAFEIGISELKEFIVYHYLNSPRVDKYRRIRPLLLWSESSVEKTLIYSVVKQLAKALKKEVILLNDHNIDIVERNPENYFVLHVFKLSSVTPEDFIGYLKDKGEYVERELPRTWYVLSNPKVHGILFLDEITDIKNNTVRRSTYQILYDHMIEWMPLSPNVLVVCAGSKRPLPASLVSRLSIIFLKKTPPSEFTSRLPRNKK